MADWTDQSLGHYLTALGSAAPTPGGGSAAALSGAMAAALGRMVAAVARQKQPTPDLENLSAEFARLEQRFLALADADEGAFARVMDALRMPKQDPERPARLQDALAHAARVPLEAATLVIPLLAALRAVEPCASRTIVSDLGVAGHLALASASSSLLNVRTNQRALADVSLRARLAREAAALRDLVESAHAALIHTVEARLAPS